MYSTYTVLSEKVSEYLNAGGCTRNLKLVQIGIVGEEGEATGWGDRKSKIKLSMSCTQKSLTTLLGASRPFLRCSVVKAGKYVFSSAKIIYVIT